MSKQSPDESNSQEEESVSIIRVRHALAENAAVVIILFLTVTAVGGYLTYTTHIEPGVAEEQRTVSTWSRTATFAHGATVTGENPVYDVGRRLTEQRAYFPRIQRVVSGEYDVSYDASSGGSTEVQTELQLLVQGRSDQTVLWGSSSALSETTVTDVTTGTTTTVEYQFNINQTRLQIEQVEETFGDVPGEPVVIVRANTQITGEVNDRVIDEQYTDELQFIPEGDAFRVRDPGELTNSTTRTQTVQVQREYSTLRRIGGPALTGSGVIFALSFGFARYRRLIAPTDDELDAVSRDVYDEWLSHGTLPDSIDPDGSDIVELQTLVDLVDVAADTGGRVLYDPTQDCYTTPGQQYNYVCWPPIHAYNNTTTDEETADDNPPQSSQSEPKNQENTIIPTNVSDDGDVGTVDTPDTSDEGIDKGEAETEVESGIFTSIRSRWNQWRGDNDTEKKSTDEHDQDNSNINNDNDDNDDADGHSHDSISSSTEASQQSQHVSNEKPRFTNDVEDNTSEAKNESKTESESESTDDMSDTADDEDTSE